MVQRMIDAIAHRGPDGDAIWSRNGIALGHRRLAIRDLSDNGRQPMLDDAEVICTTYNGEIFNYDTIRNKIEKESDYRFRSTCDAELLPIGWRLWGERLFDLIEGMFAIALWDERIQTLVLVRDGIGIKPLYVAETEGIVLFASEVKGLLASSMIRSDVDAAAFHSYLAAGYTAQDTTLIRVIRQITPGTIGYYSRDQKSERRYWQPRRNPVIRTMPEAAEAVRACLKEVTSDMLVSDVPVGLLLSGGIDSSLLAMTLRGDAPSYTASFAEPTHDESSAARSVARLAGSSWMSVSVDKGREVADDFVRVALAVDGQLADSSCLAHFALCREVRRHVTVALAGDGADEFYAGYPTYFASRVARLLSPLVPKGIASGASKLISRMAGDDERRLPALEIAARFSAGLSVAGDGCHAEWRRITPAHLLGELYGSEMRRFLGEDPLADYRRAVLTAPGNLLDRCLLADQQIYLPGDMLMKVDRCSMAHGLEIRVPFLDRRMMDLAGTIDGSLLTPLAGPKKAVLRHALSAMGAPRNVAAQSKHGFNVPLARLLRNELRNLGNTLIEANAEMFKPLLDPDGLRRIWRQHNDGSRNHAYALWAILIFGAWRSHVH